jgi:peptidoglycan/LPS O-acetylase OafA/YrhL
MLDVYRFVLALCVVQGHLLAWGAPWLAWQAVFSFYVLSGFLMTLVLNQDYGFDAGGIARFAANRALRLFPVYYAVIGLTALQIAFIGPLNQLNGALVLPLTALERFANVFMAGLVGFDSSQVAERRLSPSAWSLSIELFCYMLLAVYFAKSRARLFFMLAVGAGIAAVQSISGINQPEFGFQNHYTVLQAGLAPFAVGGLAYFYRHSRLFVFSRAKLSILGLGFFLNFLIGYWSDFHKCVSGLYVAIALNLVLVPMLFSAGSKRKWQTLLGALSYPVFLSHWFVGTLVAVCLPVIAGSFLHFVLATIGSVLFSLLLHHYIDRPIQRLRAYVKQHSLIPQKQTHLGAIPG